MKEGQKDGGSYGKKWAMDELKLQDRYYSFSIQNWEFIVLDSVHPSFDTGSGYTARLDEEQFQWLETKLNNTSTEKHICILSHIPIISFCPFSMDRTKRKVNLMGGLFLTNGCTLMQEE